MVGKTIVVEGTGAMGAGDPEVPNVVDGRVEILINNDGLSWGLVPLTQVRLDQVYQQPQQNRLTKESA